MKKTIFAVGLISALNANATPVNEDYSGFRLMGGISNINVDFDAYAEDLNQVGFVAQGGYDFNRYVSANFEFSQQTQSYENSDAEIGTKNFSVGVDVGYAIKLPRNSFIKPYGMIGLMHQAIDINTETTHYSYYSYGNTSYYKTTDTFSNTENNPYGGIGVRFSKSHLVADLGIKFISYDDASAAISTFTVGYKF